MKQNILRLLLITTISAAFFTGCSDTPSTDDEMIEIVQKFQDARNEGDIDLAASYLTEDLVWSTPTESIRGREMWVANGFRADIFEDVKSRRVEGNVVIVEMVVSGPGFEVPARAEITLKDGKISEYRVVGP